MLEGHINAAKTIAKAHKTVLSEYTFEVASKDDNWPQSPHHLLWMLDQIIEGGEAFPPTLADAEWVVKAFKWLGWVEGFMYWYGNYTLEELRRITRDAKRGTVE